MDFTADEDRDGVRLSWNVWPSNKVDSAKMVIPLGCAYTPLKPDMPFLYYEPVRCRGGNCTAILNPQVSTDFRSKIWVCPLCLGRNQFPPNYTDINENNLPAELIAQYSTVEYLLTRAQQHNPPVFLFLIDTCLMEDELQELKNALVAALSLLPENSLLGLITFGKTVQVYELGFEELPKSYVFNGAKDYTSQQIQTMLAIGKQMNRGMAQQPRTNRFLMPLSEAEFTVTNILEELQRDPYPVKNDKRPLRATGVALSVAVGLLENTVPDSGARVMLFTGGPCTVGPGMVVSEDLKEPIRSHTDLMRDNCKHTKKAIKHFEGVAKRAVTSGHVIDVFACALDQPGFYEMQDLVKKTGGLVVLADSFETPMFKQSFVRMFTRDEKGALPMGFNATIEALTSKELKVCGAIGHVASLGKKSPNVAETEIGFGGTSAWKMCGLDPIQTVALFFEPANQQAQPIAPGSKGIIQLQTTYQNAAGQRVLRVTTIARTMADMATGQQAIAEGFDQEASAVLMARIAVYKTENEELFDILPWLDKMLIRLCNKFATFQPGNVNSFQLAPTFGIYPQFMFHLRRSNFFQAFNNSPDETAFFRYMLNREDVTDSLIMIQPTLDAYSFNGPPVPVLLASTSVQPDRILVLDTFFRIILFSGETIANWRRAGYAEDPKHENFKQLLLAPKEDVQAILKKRFPLPRYIECDQGSSQARFLLATIDPVVTHTSMSQSSSSGEVIRTDDVSLKVFMDHLKKLAVTQQ
eukprot:TRINITY_DN1387_c0_g2_i2.p1 TRINITY_DN1387_c0_g2~~TRINITY_DN1387_c0_g2_i2.p1  ORF type:complete len:752 (+),score=199.83 TRINITY_DN1387_c0_g2_i2:97-2352(+)